MIALAPQQEPQLARSEILAVDPGPEESAIVIYDAALGQPLDWRKVPNREALEAVGSEVLTGGMAIEMVASYGMPVGADVFETCVWIGRFIERRCSAGRPVPRRIFRRDCKLHLCGSQRAKDSNIRQALIDRYGPGRDKAIGKKASPGPLYGMKADCWQALAVAITAAETSP